MCSFIVDTHRVKGSFSQEGQAYLRVGHPRRPALGINLLSLRVLEGENQYFKASSYR